MGDDYDGASFDDKLKTYYGRLFPFDLMYEWLAYNGPGAAATSSSEAFSKRELSFTLKDDVYIRYLSYADAAEWKADMIKRVPHKIDMGAIYTVPPKQKNYCSKEAFKEVEREFILDIDLTDYQDDGTIQTNCVDPGDPEFKKSFRFMALAVRILNRALKEDFGFKNLLWVFSGRRGIHCWVCDKRARTLSNSARTAVVDYLNVFKGGEKEKSKLTATSVPLHPSLRKAFEAEISPIFETLLEEQGWLENSEKWCRTLELVPDEDIRDHLRSKVAAFVQYICSNLIEVRVDQWAERRNANMSALSRWEDLTKEVKKSKKNNGEYLFHIMFTLAYPRLDVNVSKMMNHLLKSPFCVHPKTQRICVPMNPETIYEFDPSKVPRLNDVLRELNTAKDAHESRETSMEIHRSTFKQIFLKPLTTGIVLQRRAQAQSVEAF